MLRFLTAPPLRPIAWYPTISAQPQVSFTDLLSWQIPVASVPTPMSLWHSSARTCSNCVYTILSQNLLSCATHERKKSERAEFIFGTRLFPSAFPLTARFSAKQSTAEIYLWKVHPILCSQVQRVFVETRLFVKIYRFPFLSKVNAVTWSGTTNSSLEAKWKWGRVTGSFLPVFANVCNSPRHRV